MARKLTTRQARAMAAQRKTYGAGNSHGKGGRPRSNAPRCKCGADSLARALSRARKDGKCPANDGHEAGCPFYREPAIVI